MHGFSDLEQSASGGEGFWSRWKKVRDGAERRNDKFAGGEVKRRKKLDDGMGAFGGSIDVLLDE